MRYVIWDVHHSGPQLIVVHADSMIEAVARHFDGPHGLSVWTGHDTHSIAWEIEGTDAVIMRAETAEDVGLIAKDLRSWAMDDIDPTKFWPKELGEMP